MPPPFTRACGQRVGEMSGTDWPGEAVDRVPGRGRKGWLHVSGLQLGERELALQ